MSTNKQALREAAEKATRGIWRYLKTTPFMDAEISAENNTRVVNLLSGDVTEANSEFIAAANPATVLALLDELAAAEKRNADLAEFIHHVKKCLVRNREYAPLSHEEIDNLLGINAAGITVKGDSE